jgi:sigma-B regulation protein RsbU (phosphoserine phosphatase)
VSLVLVADDSKEALSELCNALEAAGHSVLEAKTAREAILEAQDNDPDLLLIDISLPDMHVLEMLEELRSDSSLARVPIMMMAEDAESDLLHRTFKWDIVDFVHKPINLPILMAKVGAHTRLNQAYKFSRKLSKEMFMSRIDRLEIQVQATDEDLSEAERHFSWMQPKPPEADGYKIEVYYRPYGRLGGDFYDFVWLDRDKLGIVVGDVSGHGIQAAILQTMARKLISLGLRQCDGDLHKVVEFANRELTNDLPPGSFVAAQVGILNTETHEWSHVRCGVPYPIYIKDKKGESIMTPGGPLGLSKKADWAVSQGEHTVKFEVEETMLMMSDGIIECIIDEETKDQFDVEGVLDAIEKTKAKHDYISKIVEMSDVEQMADDDATMISITRT